MKFLVTGGAGFVGSYLVESLLNRGHEVRVLEKITGDLERFKTNPKLEIVIGGMEDPETVGSVMKGVDVVYHLAWAFPAKATDAFKIDVGGYINVLDAAVANKVRQFLFCSSSIVYGEPAYQPVDENHPHLIEKSRSPIQALTKSTVHKLSAYYYTQYKLPSTIFVFWWAYGREHIPSSTFRGIIDTALKGETIRVPQKASGSIAYLGDIARAFELATLNKKAYGQEFNLSSFKITWRNLIALIIKSSNSSSKIETVSDEKWDGPAFLTGVWDISTKKAESLLGYKPDPEKAKAIFIQALKKDIIARKEVLGISK